MIKFEEAIVATTYQREHGKRHRGKPVRKKPTTNRMLMIGAIIVVVGLLGYGMMGVVGFGQETTPVQVNSSVANTSSAEVPIAPADRESKFLGAAGHTYRASRLPVYAGPMRNSYEFLRPKGFATSIPNCERDWDFQSSRTRKNPGSAFWAPTGVSLKSSGGAWCSSGDLPLIFGGGYLMPFPFQVSGR